MDPTWARLNPEMDQKSKYITIYMFICIYISLYTHIKPNIPKILKNDLSRGVGPMEGEDRSPAL